MSTPLAGKVAIVTGGSKGIGAATVVELARQGAKVVINFSSDATPAEELVKQIGPDNALAVKADAASVAGVEDLVKQTVAKFGKIDILIPNAGLLPMKDLESTTEADFDKTFAINVKGPYFLAQVSVHPMRLGRLWITLTNTHPRKPPLTCQKAAISSFSLQAFAQRQVSRPTIFFTTAPRAQLNR